jgi:hypothetical protein
MIPGIIGIGSVGSAVDVATLIVVLVGFGARLRPRLETVSAGLIALAQREPGVDDARLADELDVDQRQVRAMETKIIETGGDES